MKKKYKTILVSLVISLLLVGIIVYHFTNKNISGDKWFLMQEDYITSLETLTTSMDNVTSLYINGNIEVDDYFNHMTVIQQEMDIINKSYSEMNDTYHVKVGTYSYETKAGCEAVSKSLSEVSNLISDCMTESTYMDKQKLSYTYMAYMQSLSEILEDYSIAYDSIYAENEVEHE